MKVLFIVYDNESSINDFPLNIAYLSAVLREAGHDVTIYSQDVFHYPESHLTDYLNRNHFDIVGLGFVAGYWQYRKALKISKAVNDSTRRKDFSYILGGHGPSPDPEYFLKKTGADIVVLGEGERTIIELCDEEKYRPRKEIDGIAYIQDGKLVKTKPRELIQDLDSIPFPAWDLFPIEHYVLIPYPNKGHTDRLLPMLSSRGCSFRCNFCYRLDKGIRFRKVEKVAEEMQVLNEKYRINFVPFFDELLMTVPKRTEEICKAIIDLHLDIHWLCNGRLNYAKPRILKLMKKAGCVFINYGIESMDDQVLKNMNKALTVEVIKEGVKATLSEGISPGLNIIFGNIGDNAQSLRQGVKFILKHNDYSQFRTIRPVTPYPGCDLYYEAIKRGMIKDIGDFYENKHTNSDLMTCNFTDLTDNEFYKELYNANKVLVYAHLKHQIDSYDTTMQKLYLERDTTFRGYRHT
jgi:radical SAM superfamily enzyme YgiQ (UPF0313 family)